MNRIVAAPRRTACGSGTFKVLRATPWGQPEMPRIHRSGCLGTIGLKSIRPDVPALPSTPAHPRSVKLQAPIRVSANTQRLGPRNRTGWGGPRSGIFAAEGAVARHPSCTKPWFVPAVGSTILSCRPRPWDLWAGRHISAQRTPPFRVPWRDVANRRPPAPAFLPGSGSDVDVALTPALRQSPRER